MFEFLRSLIEDDGTTSGEIATVELPIIQSSKKKKKKKKNIAEASFSYGVGDHVKTMFGIGKIVKKLEQTRRDQFYSVKFDKKAVKKFDLGVDVIKLGSFEFQGKINETATPGSTNTSDFSNDFGTDTPRLPSELGDLTGHKSLGMGGGFTDYNLSARDPFTGEKYELLRVLNTQGSDHTGDSTTKAPVIYSPFDVYVPNGQFILDQNDKSVEQNKAIQSAADDMKRATSLKSRLQDEFFKQMKG